MSNLTDFMGGNIPVGMISSSPALVNDSGWAKCDGRVVLRTLYPRLAAIMTGQAGVPTYTARTLGSGPSNAYVGAADTTNFLIAANAGATTIQASPDAITWTQGSGWTASTTAINVIKANTRYVMQGLVDNATPNVINTNQTAAITVVKANWTATTGWGGLLCDPNSLAYGLGVTIAVTNGAVTAAIYSMADAGVAWVTKAVSSATHSQVAFDGTYFWITNTGGQFLTRWDGTTAVDVTLPFKYAASPGSPHIASDGAGTIVLLAGQDSGSGTLLGLLTSKDNGVTWVNVLVQSSDSLAPTSGTIYFAGGLFKFPNQGGIPRYSRDGLTFGNVGATPPNVSGFSGLIAKSSVFLEVQSGQTIASTFTEDFTKMALPRTSRANITAAGITGNIGYQEWIKVN